MSRRCVAKTCFNSPAVKPTLKFFCFPKEEEMCRIWAEKCGRPDLLELPRERLAKVRLCADHFETQWFLNPQHKTAFIRSARPIPTIFHNNLHDYIPDSMKRNFDSTYCNSPSTAGSKATESDALAETYVVDEEVSLQDEQNESEVSASTGCHKMCRLCACLVQETKLIDIFSNQETDVLHKINKFLGDKVIVGDDLPHYICELCVEKLNYCDETISSFIAADKKLRDLFLVKTEKRQHLMEYVEGLNECEKQNNGNDAELYLTGNSDCIHTEGSEENELSPAVGSCKKVYMIRKKNGANVLEPTHISENDFDDGAFEVLSKDELDCEVLEECLSPSVNDSESYLNGDLAQFVNVHLQEDDFLIKSTSNGNMSVSASESTEEMKVYQCSKCNENFPNKSKLLFHEISNHVVETSVKFENDGSSLRHVKVNANLVNNVVSKKYKRERVTCKQCGQEFLGQRPLKRHVRECHVPNDNVCLYCGAHYSVKSQLIAHLRLHTNEKPYSCRVCDAKFHFKKELRRHKHSHVKSQIMACNICDKVFKTNHSLWRHKQIHSQNRCVLCYLCGKVLSNAQSLKVHLRTHSSERPCTCNTCGKKFKDSTSLSKHVVMHSTEKNFTCDICSRAFYSRALVKQHKLSHSGVKPHKCEVCGSCFNRLGNLNQHKKRHACKEEHEKPNLNMLYECSVCGKKMKSELTLKYHIAKHTGEKKPFDCDSCGKRFVAIEPYRVHMRIHTGERPYVCEVCNKSFRSPYTLKQHMGLHRDEFPYLCPFCDRRFKRLQSLIVHKRTHTGEKPHVCPMCSRCFAQKGDMLKHTKTHSRDNLPPPSKDHGDELVLEIDHIPDFALSDAEITNEFLINMPIVEVQTEIQ